MKLKLTAALLSSVLTSASYAADGVVATEVEVVQRATPQKAVPDCFEGAGEYRERRATLERQLKSMEGKKLKEFTPEIFDSMLTEAIGIASLGLDIFGKLQNIEAQINEQLKVFIERIKSFNALISWRDLFDLAQLYPVYTSEYWNEFVFEFNDILAKADLQAQVKAAHEYTLQHSQEWNKIRKQRSHFSGWSTYNELKNAYQSTLTRLIKHKLLEEKTDSILSVFPCFLEEIQKRGVAYSPSFDPSFNPVYMDTCAPLNHMMGWLENKVLGVATRVDSSLWYIHRDLITPYALEPENLKEDWYAIYFSVSLTITPVEMKTESRHKHSQAINMNNCNNQEAYQALLAIIQEKHKEAMDVIMKMLLTQ